MARKLQREGQLPTLSLCLFTQATNVVKDVFATSMKNRKSSFWMSLFPLGELSFPSNAFRMPLASFNEGRYIPTKTSWKIRVNHFSLFILSLFFSFICTFDLPR